MTTGWTDEAGRGKSRGEWFLAAPIPCVPEHEENHSARVHTDRFLCPQFGIFLHVKTSKLQ